MKIADKYIPQGYYAGRSVEKTIRKGKEYRYRATFAIWDGDRWHQESETKGLYTKDLADAWLKAKVDAFKDKGLDITLNPDTVRGFVEEHYKPFLINEKDIQYKYEFQKLDVICEYLGDKLIDDVTKLDAYGLKNWLMDRPYKRGNSERKRTKASAQRYMSRFRALIHFAEEVGKRRNNHFSFKGIISKKNEQPKKSYITFEQFMQVLDACYEIPKCNRWKRDRSHLRLTLIAAYTTGWRIGELRDVTRGMIQTDSEKRVGVIKSEKPDAENKIHTKTVEITRWLYGEMEAAGVFEKRDDEKVFNTTNYYELVKDVFKRAGLGPEVTFHTLRAANATERDTAWQDRESIHSGLGWSKDSTVPQKHYMRHQDYHIIEKGKPFDDRLERMRQEYSARGAKEADDVLNADSIE